MKYLNLFQLWKQKRSQRKNSIHLYMRKVFQNYLIIKTYKMLYLTVVMVKISLNLSVIYLHKKINVIKLPNILFKENNTYQNLYNLFSLIFVLVFSQFFISIETWQVQYRIERSITFL